MDPPPALRPLHPLCPLCPLRPLHPLHLRRPLHLLRLLSRRRLLLVLPLAPSHPPLYLLRSSVML